MIIQRTYQNEPKLKEIRRSLRSEGPSAEKILWKYLRKNQLGYKFRRQFSIGNFVADFYCHELKLIIELDGWTHDSQITKHKDFYKEQFFINKGCSVFRISNNEIYEDPEKFIFRIKEICDKLSKRLTPPFIPPLIGEGAIE